ncbi:6,7-dimethyl-8-ribityllumazine synthase [Flavihumibacter fluvii]|uniref:6,7-dimethyl-8-ribityllumazine synthase n=1 Tax=Flavihumibacter fluvii TaxID=2838157 RepID=UPI001BDED69A|nr:6,7-dimethyl-8-ribityllumazine synthase [Flavihumibacter fluvii]ULQ53974.1 6,7-dimethyl-8-ribityllumazine synthase [Flavihumibacter fluvii]
MASTGNTNLFQLDAGILSKDACIVIIKTEWNAAIVDELENGCRRVFGEYGVTNLLTISVPGAVEIPFAIKAYFDAKKYSDERPHAFIALGCVIKGDTPHFDYVCKAVTDGVVMLNLSLPVPVIFGVLTVNTEEQALERIGGIHGHKGNEAAITAMKMITLQQSFKQ